MMKLATKTLLACTAAAALLAGSAQAVTVNFNYQRGQGNFTGVPSADPGGDVSVYGSLQYGLWGQDTGKVWNVRSESARTNLKDENGDATTIGYTFTVSGGSFFYDADGPVDDLTAAARNSGNGGNIELTIKPR